MYTFKNVWKKQKFAKKWKISSPAGSRIFQFFLDFFFFFCFFLHFFKGINKEKYQLYIHSLFITQPQNFLWTKISEPCPSTLPFQEDRGVEALERVDLIYQNV